VRQCDWSEIANSCPELDNAVYKIGGKPLYYGSPGSGHWLILPQTFVCQNWDASVLVYLYPRTKTAIVCDFTALRFNLLLMGTPVTEVYNQPSYVLTLPVLWNWEVHTEIVHLKSLT
jgi:hypothetical protein